MIKIYVRIYREGADITEDAFYVRDSIDSIRKKVSTIMYALEDSVSPVHHASWAYADNRDGSCDDWGMHIINR